MKALRALLALGYPLLVLAGLQLLEPRSLGLALAGLFGLRAATRWRELRPERLRPLLAPALGLLAVVAATVWSNDDRVLRAVPVLVNGALLFAFARSLRTGPPLVESFARLQVPELPPAEVRYCRSVTRLWCAFFALNIVVCTVLALRGSLVAWAAWTGAGAYLAVGLVYAAEFVVRAHRFGRYEGTLVEPLFRRWFPLPRPGRSEGPAAERPR